MSRRLLLRASFRSWLHHPLQLGLSILGVALGVAVAMSVDVVNASAREAFRLSTEAVTGRTTDQVVAGSAGLPDDLYRDIRLEAGVRTAAPVVDGWVEAADGRTLRLLGIDPLAEASVRDTFAPTTAGGAIDLATWMSGADAVWVTEATARGLDVRPGDELEIRVRGEWRTLRLAGFLAVTGPGAEGLRDVLVADVSTAQDTLGRIGRLDRIDLLSPGPAALERVRALLPGDAVVAAAAARADSTLQMTRAFSLNLQAMSLLALVCGVFLIYNTMTFSVVRRRPLIGRLRVVGVTRGEIFGLVLLEALAIGVVGTVAGLVLGRLLAGGMLSLVTRTINDLYFTLTVRDVAVDPTSVLRAALLGVGATLLAALAPAREATRTPPRSTLLRSDAETRSRRLVPGLAAAGVVAAGSGVVAVMVPTQSLLVAFAGLFLLVLGASLLAPAATWLLAAMVGPPLRRVGGLLGALAARSVVANLSRTAVAVAALMISISVIIGVGVMVVSFRGSLVGWLGYTLQADLYVSPATGRAEAADLAVPDDLRQRLASHPGVAGVSSIRAVELAVGSETVQLLALEPGPSTRDSYDLVDGDPAVAWDRFENGAAFVSEPYAYRAGIAAGDAVRLPTPAGTRMIPVAAVFRSYAPDQGAVMVHREFYARHWGDRGVSGLSVEAVDAADVEPLRALLEASFAGRQPVVVVSNRELRERSLEVFDRTFLITGVLRVLVSAVAFVGVFSALMAMALERSRELGILRASGLTPRQLFALVIAQTGLLGLIAGVLALPLGTALAWVMIHVINRRSFGWSLDMQLPPGTLIEALVLAIVAALLAGMWPAIQRARGLPAAALREE